MGEQMRLNRLDIEVEVAMVGNCKMITRVHDTFDEYFSSDTIWARQVSGWFRTMK